MTDRDGRCFLSHCSDNVSAVMAESLYGNADSFQHIKGDILFGVEDNIGDLGSATFSLASETSCLD